MRLCEGVRCFASKSGQHLVNAVLDLSAVNDGLKRRGVRFKVEQVREGLWLRGTFRQIDGSSKRQRLSLALKATPQNLLEAESRCLDLARVIASEGHLPLTLPWEQAAPDPNEVVKAPTMLTVSQAVERLEADFWQGRIKTAAATRTWQRLKAETDRLPESATLSMDLLVAVGDQQEPGSRTRQESLKVFKRLAKLVGLEGTDRLDALRTTYEPSSRTIPTDEQLKTLLEAMDPNHRWAWPLWALVNFGCRPAEVFSLTLNGDKTAEVLTVKRKDRAPTWRTALQLKVSDLELERSVPWDVTAPDKYDSLEARRLNQNWGKWLNGKWSKGIAPGLQLYDIRHAWAVRSIRKNLNASLCARCMGHSLDTHSRTYHRWMSQNDIAAVAANL